MDDFFRLVKSWLNGTYRVFPWRTLFVLVLIGLYAVNPFDLIPDFIPIVGVIDDAAMLGFLVRSLMKDLQKFREWEGSQVQAKVARQGNASPPSSGTGIVDAEFTEVT